MWRTTGLSIWSQDQGKSWSRSSCLPFYCMYSSKPDDQTQNYNFLPFFQQIEVFLNIFFSLTLLAQNRSGKKGKNFIRKPENMKNTSRQVKTVRTSLDENSQLQAKYYIIHLLAEKDMRRVLVNSHMNVSSEPSGQKDQWCPSSHQKQCPTVLGTVPLYSAQMRPYLKYRV